MKTTATILVIAFGLLVIRHTRADERSADIPSAHTTLAQLFTSDFRKLSIDPTSIKRGAHDTFTIIVYNTYSKKARAAGLVPDHVAASSGRVEIDCDAGTFRVVSDYNLDGANKIIGSTGDAGAGGVIRGNQVVAEIAAYTCLPGTAAAQGNGT